VGGGVGGVGGVCPGLGGPDCLFRCRRRNATIAPTMPAATPAPMSTHAHAGRPPDSEELFSFDAAAAAAAAAAAWFDEVSVVVVVVGVVVV
jgi:hypothetical protein